MNNKRIKLKFTIDLTNEELSLATQILGAYEFTGNGQRCAQFSSTWVLLMRAMENPTQMEADHNGAPVHGEQPSQAGT